MFGVSLFLSLVYFPLQEGLRKKIPFDTDPEDIATTNKVKVVNPKDFFWEQRWKPKKISSDDQNPRQVTPFSSDVDDRLAPEEQSNTATTFATTTRHSNRKITTRTISDSLTSCFPCIPRVRSALRRRALSTRQRLMQLEY